MDAALLLGQVRHARLRPRAHAFAYPSWMLLLPLRAWRARPEGLPLARNRRGLVAFHDRDHGEGGPDALAWFEALLAREGVHGADGEVWLQTYPRVLGQAFKPVSFWYAHARDGRLVAVLAEVNNTFGERHAYLLHEPGTALTWGRELSARKVFHVSPFCRVEGRYRFRFLRTAADGEGRPAQLVARVELDDAEGPLLRTSIGGRLEPLSRAALWRAWRAMPLLGLGVLARIHWQAMRLWLKRVPVFGKPLPPAEGVSR